MFTNKNIQTEIVYYRSAHIVNMYLVPVPAVQQAPLPAVQVVVLALQGHLGQRRTFRNIIQYNTIYYIHASSLIKYSIIQGAAT